MNSNFPTKDYRNNSILKVSNNPNMSLMPSKFQSADNNSSFSNGRNLFFRTYGKNTINNNVDLTNFLNETGKYECQTNCNHFSCKSNTISSNTGKYIKTQSSDQHIQKLKNQAIGKGTMAKKEHNNYINSFSTSNNTNNNTVKQALQRNRNKGYVVPPKVTSKISCKVPNIQPEPEQTYNVIYTLVSGDSYSFYLENNIITKNDFLYNLKNDISTNDIFSIELLGHITTIGEDTFRCDYNESIYSDRNIVYEGTNPWKFLSKITSSSVTNIQEYAFSCFTIKHIEIPFVIDISNNAFQGCLSLETIDIPNLTIIQSQVFWDCFNLSSIDLSSIKIIGYNVFQSTKLQTINISSIEKIGENAFKSSLLSEVIWNGFRYFKASDFINDSSNAIIDISDNAFDYTPFGNNNDSREKEPL